MTGDGFPVSTPLHTHQYRRLREMMSCLSAADTIGSRPLSTCRCSKARIVFDML